MLLGRRLLAGGHICQLENAVLLSVGGQGGRRVGKVGHHVGATQVQLRSLAAAERSLRGKVSASRDSGPQPPSTKCFSSSAEALSPSPSSSSNNQVLYFRMITDYQLELLSFIICNG